MFGPLVAARTPVLGTRLYELLDALVKPGFYLAEYWGVKGGPDGVPGFRYVYALTFLIWWALIDLCQAAWRWVGAK